MKSINKKNNNASQTMRLTTTLLFTGLSLCGTSAVKAEAVYNNRDSAAFYYNLGQEEQTARRFSNAWRWYEKATKFDSRDSKIQLAIADVCLQMNRMAPAVKALEAASSINPGDIATKYKLTQLYFNFGQYNKVIDALPSIHEKMPNIPHYGWMMGKSYHSIQNYGKAIDYLKMAMKEEPQNADAPYLIGRMNVQMENYKAAIPYYQRALTIDSVSQPARTYEYALVLATAEQFDASVRTFQAAIERGYKPRDDFYMNMAYTMADAHKTTEAILMMKEMLQRRPQDIGLINGLADVCYHSGRYKDAIGYWDRLLAIDGKNARALYQIGLAYIKMGNDKDGQKLCDEAISMDPALAVLKHARQMPF